MYKLKLKVRTASVVIMVSVMQLTAGLALAAEMITQKPVMKMTVPIPVSITAPDKVRTSIGTLEYFDGVPSEQTIEIVYDYLDRSRAVNAYLNSIPMLSMNALREGQAAAGCATSNQICIVDTLMDSKSLFLTGNTSTMYAFGFLALDKDGPTVVDLPTRMLGVLDDMAFRYHVRSGHGRPGQRQRRQVSDPAARV